MEPVLEEILDAPFAVSGQFWFSAMPSIVADDVINQ